MSTALVPLIGNRPPIIVVAGVTVYLSIRDREYLRMKQAKRAAVVALHPDKAGALSDRRHALARRALKLKQRATYRPRAPGNHRLFRETLASFRSWLVSQRREYWALNETMPPDWHGPPEPPPGFVPKPQTPARLSGWGRWSPDVERAP